MRAPVQTVHEIVTRLTPGDALEAEHRATTLAWLERTDDVYRRAKPATPDVHLVSYVCLIDPADRSVLLVDHINAGLWLPAGGHVELDEHPWLCATREAQEELTVSDPPEPDPVLLTVTTTRGGDPHTDVSLWFVVHIGQDVPLTIDRTELREARWWAPTQVAATPASAFDPHLARFLRKVAC